MDASTERPAVRMSKRCKMGKRERKSGEKRRDGRGTKKEGEEVRRKTVQQENELELKAGRSTSASMG